ncbi:MAG: RagB/SusD family nutrient uptake outer membrane protein, partial [Muribaculaceae bacterium]|nr:RagB/SusD family nutrient uptake outer membrane protein [Muribaculaceae bacterium]
MKLKNFIIAVSVAFSSVFTSCSLNEEVDGFSEPQSFYQTKAQCVAALNSCYIPLKNIYTYKMMLATEATTDIAYARSGTLDA